MDDRKHDIEYAEYSFCFNRNAAGLQCPSMGGSGTQYSEMLELLRQELCFPCQRLVDILRETRKAAFDSATTVPSDSIQTVQCGDDSKP